QRQKEIEMNLFRKGMDAKAVWQSVGLFLVVMVLLAGCTKAVPSDGDQTVVKRFDDLRGVRYCEVFLVGGTIWPKDLQAAFYNTTDLNDVVSPRDTCPTDLWAKVDPETLKKQYDVWGVFKNASSGKSVGNWRAQRYGSLRNRWSLRHVASRECCSSSEPLWISGPPSA